MDQGKEGQVRVQDRGYPDIIEREVWNGWIFEARYDGRWSLGPRFKVAYLYFWDASGKPYYDEMFSIEPLLEKGFDIPSALRYAIHVSKTTIAVLTSRL